MAAPGDRINPIDAILGQLSVGPLPDELPAELLCPSNHRVYRVLISIGVEDQPETLRLIPVWVCSMCVVAYRLQECRLVPGEEGVA